MTLFEFILVMVSLVLAIGITHLLQGIMAILRDRQAIALQWVRLIWASSLLLWAVYYWWSLWDFRLADWTYPSFIFVLLAPTSLFAAITLLFSSPGEPSSPVHWKPFEEVRRLFFTVYLVYTVVWSADGWVVGVEPAWNDLRLPQMVAVLVVLVGLVGSARIANIIAVFFLLTALAGVFGGPRFEPGAFGPQ